MNEGKVGFQNTSIFDKAGSQKDGKSDSKGSASASPPCPECGSTRRYRDGLRYLSDGSSVQRWLCRDCAYRFSEKPPQKKLKWQINTANTLTSKRRICANREEAKNLTTATETKTVAGDLTKLPQETKGLITKYMAYLERQGYYEDSCYLDLIKSLAKDGANLLDPENVKTKIARHKKHDRHGNDRGPWAETTKMLATYAYDAFCKMEGLVWEPPHYKQGETLLYVPDEKDLDQLINASHSKRMTTYLQCLKETFADPGEVLRAEWRDLNDDILTINHPVKGHLPGRCQLSPQLTAMLSQLPKKDKRIFPTTYPAMKSSFDKLRTRAAAYLQNPKLLQISFKSYRHWGGSMLAHVTNGNVLEIKRRLRHKNIQNTMKYIHTIEYKNEDYDIATATTPEEIKELGKAGWTKYDEATFNGVQMHFYRKPKRFGGASI